MSESVIMLVGEFGSGRVRRGGNEWVSGWVGSWSGE